MEPTSCSRGHREATPDDLLARFTVGAADSAAVSDYVSAFPHLRPRLMWLSDAVGQLWPGLRLPLRIEITLDPESGDPELVVMGDVVGTSAAATAERIVRLYDQLYDAFGAWPGGVGFAVLIVNRDENP